jgi:hypothetical protein
MSRIIWILLLGLSSAAGAQEVFQGNSATVKLPADLYQGAAPEPDLHQYLSADGGFDECRYWRDHPDPTTLLYGWPEAFPPGQIGQTEGVNGQPAPYVRCAVNPCPPHGYICWRNPAAQGPPPSPSAAANDMLRQKGCAVGAGGQIICPAPHPGPPGSAASAQTGHCRLMPNGNIDCDTSTDDAQYMPLPGNGGRLQAGTTVNDGFPNGGPLTGNAAKAPNPPLEGTTTQLGPLLRITIGQGWQENHEARGKVANSYWGEAEGTVATRKDSEHHVIKDRYGNPTYYFVLRHLTVKSTRVDVLAGKQPVEIEMQSVFTGY